MFKKLTAVTLAAVMLLMPMTASAVTWGDIIDEMWYDGEYDDGKTCAKLDLETQTITVEKGNITPDKEGNVSIYFDKYCQNVIEKIIFDDVTITSNGWLDLIALEDANGQIAFTENTVINHEGPIWISADEGGKIEVVNNSNQVTLTGDDEYTAAVIINVRNPGQVTVGGNGSFGAEGMHPAIISTDLWQDDGLPSVETMREIYSQIDGAVLGDADARIYDIYMVMDENYESIVQYVWDIEKNDYVRDENGDPIKYIFGEPQPSAPKFPKPSPEELRRREMERKRQKEAIGGVSASPYWVKQLFLGYRSLNLRLYIGGEQVNFRERLGWLVEEGAKRLNLRVNTENPENVTMRFDEEVLDILDRAEISTLVLQDKSSDAIMTYRVSDLRAAYEKYGLNGTDLLVVGGENDDVMKIGADGQMVPVEQETEAAAA